MPMGNTAHLGPRETVCGCVTRPLLQIKLGCNTDKNQNTFISKLTIMVSANKLNDYNKQKKVINDLSSQSYFASHQGCLIHSIDASGDAGIRFYIMRLKNNKSYQI